MSVGRVVGLLVLVIVLYSVITQPTESAAATRDGMGHLSDAGTSLTQFMSALASGDGSDEVATGSDGVEPTAGEQSTDSDTTGSGTTGSDTTGSGTTDHPVGGVDTGDGTTDR